MHARLDRFRLALVVAVAVSGAIPMLAQTQATPPSRVTQAEGLVDALVAKQFAKITGLFDATMKSAMPDDALKKGWEGALLDLGTFIRRGAGREQQKGAYTLVVVGCEFARGKMEVTVVFDAEGRIAGLQMRPPAPPPQPPYTAPDYAVASAYTEREVNVGSGEWVLPGTLTVPAGPGPFPAVVFVHGSGPNDRDESFGPNKTFKDLALGLGSRGVAVLRYDKRTLVHKAKVAPLTQFTVKEETIDDALLAVEFLRRESSIDPAKVFMLGHSLGGMVAPRIAAADARLAGIIVMAGAVRSFDQAVFDQYTYLANSDGKVSPTEQLAIDEARRTIDVIAKLTAADAQTGRSIAGGPASYWLDLRGFDPPAAAARLPHRILVMQGARDYQVTVADFERWKAALSGRPNVQFRLYPSLNHMFLAGTGKSLPAEYLVPGHVPVEVIEDIASWIKG